MWTKRMGCCAGAWLGILGLGMVLATDAAAQVDYPQPAFPQSQWWNDDWFERGQLTVPQNYPVRVEEVAYQSGDHEVPALVARPDDQRAYPAVLFQHGRRGLGDLVQKHLRRLAARGFVVLAPNVYDANFIEPFPTEHDYALEDDVAAGLDALLARTDISTTRACLYSHTRGGYYTLKVSVTKARQEKQAVCYVSYYPHMQDPNAPEPAQVYRYAPETDALTIPVLIFIGEREQYQRRRSIETAVKALQDKGRDARLFVYPGVGRGFDFRPRHVRTLADDLASKDALLRAADFMRAALRPFAKE